MGNLDDAAAELRQRLKSAVEIAARLGCSAGGVSVGAERDSSGVVALAAGLRADPLTCLSIGFEDPRYDESGYAEQVAARYGVHGIRETMQGDDPALVGRLPNIFDEPFGDSSALPSLELMQLARRHVTVAISGDGGDELLAGYRALRLS